MADDRPVQNLCDETTCAVCLEYFKDPVILDCGHIFCQACITQCYEKTDTQAACPQCREPIQQRSFRPNRQLAIIVEIAKKFSLQVAKETEGPGGVCERHQEPLKLFCQDDQAPICVVCDRSKDHRKHQVIPIDEAAEEYQGKIESHLEFLKKKREAILSSKQSGQTESQNLLEKTEAQRQKIVAEFKQLHEFLEEQERLLLAQLKDLDDEVNDATEKHLAKLLEELSSLDSLIEEMEEKQKQPANEFLQDIRSTLQRCKQNTFVNPVVFPPALEQQIEQLSEMYSFPEVKKCLDAVFSGHQEKTANVLENVRTIPTLMVSLSQNSQARQNYEQYHGFYSWAPPDPYELRCWSSVLGFERITSGTHSWAVDVGCEYFWAVGVAKESVRGLSDLYLRAQHGIWAVGRLHDNQLFAVNPGMSLLQCHMVGNRMQLCSMPRKIHVILNYEEGSVTFVNAESNSTIFTFNGLFFSGEEICSWCGKGLL